MTFLPAFRTPHIFGLLAFLVASGATVMAQNKATVVAKGFFDGDSVRIGEPVAYILTARYPEQYTVLFPDSTYNFKPFEFARKKVFPTVTRRGISRDSVVYWLNSFEIDSVQSLVLPVFSVSGTDSTFIPTTDSLHFSALVAQMPPDSVDASMLPLRTDTRYTAVHQRFNYLLASIIIGGIAILLVALWLIFGNKIRRQFKIKRLTRDYNRFLVTYNQLIEKLGHSFSSGATEKTLYEWKKYMEHLDHRPYTKLTTRETVIMEKDPRIGQELGTIDRAIYGHEGDPIRPLEKLRGYAEKKYLKKLNELLNG